MWDAEDVHTRLTAMRGRDPLLTEFGARRHRLGPALTEAEVTRFEAEHGVALPHSYRAFLREVGDGGAGPHYGLFPLSGDGMNSLERDERSWPGYLSTPFPHTGRWNPVDAMSEAEYFDARWTTGSLVIAEFGCGAFHRLVVTGPARGQVWFDDRGADNGLTPGADFRTWYQTWLDQQSRNAQPDV